MKTRTFTSIVVMMLFQFVVQALCDDTSSRQHIIVLVDLSDSGLHITNENFAQKAAMYIRDIIQEAPLGSTIELRTFGEYDRSKNLVSFTFQLSRKPGNQPTEVGRKIGLFIGNIPRLIAEEKLVMQKKSSLIGELKIIAQRLNQKQNTHLIILSDMLEYSTEANCYQLIQNPQAQLPGTAQCILTGTEITALGAGYGVKNSTENEKLKVLWAEWLKKAGVDKFLYLSDF